MPSKKTKKTTNKGPSPAGPPTKKKTTTSIWIVAAAIPGIIVAFLAGWTFRQQHSITPVPPPATKPTTTSTTTSTTASTARRLDKFGGPPGSWTHGYYAEETSSTEPASNAWLYPNGGGGNGKYTSFQTDDDFTALGRVYNDLGQIVPTRHHFKDGDHLFSGPTEPGQHFQWPSIKVGLRRPVPGLFGGNGKQVELETLTDPNEDNGFSPRVFYVHNFLSNEETEELIRISTADENPYKMAPSTAGSHKGWDKEGGRDQVLSTRTSMNAFDISSTTARKIKQRAFRLLRMGRYVENMADGIQILRYELGQAYISHEDYFPANQSEDYNWNPEKGGANRMATIFLYLSDVEYGGQTVFPRLEKLTSDTSADLVERLDSLALPTSDKEELVSQAHIKPGSWEDDLVQKCSTQFAVPPRRGDAILFYSQKPNGRLDPASLHGACPVLKGTKWGANLWVWNACRYSLCQGDPLNPVGELPDGVKAPFK